MIYLKYQGSDFPVDFRIKNPADNTYIDPAALVEVSVYCVDQSGAIAEKFSLPEKEDYELLEIVEDSIRAWMKRQLTKTLAGKLLHFEINYAEENQELEDNKQRTIVLSDQVKIIGVPIEAES
jgi:hypothetical protein